MPVILTCEPASRPDASPVYGVDETFTIYYDETNNVRKLYLTDDGFNTELQVLTLPENSSPLHLAPVNCRLASTYKFVHVILHANDGRFVARPCRSP